MSANDPSVPSDPVPAGTTANAGHALARGGCLCGAVRFTARLPSLWVAHCHCTMCQRAHGAAFVTWVGFDRSGFSFEAGAIEPTWHVSSPGARRGFCPRCGSPMCFESTRWPGEVHVARALVTDPLDRPPAAHVFYETHVAWLDVNDPLPKVVGTGDGSDDAASGGG